MSSSISRYLLLDGARARYAFNCNKRPPPPHYHYISNQTVTSATSLLIPSALATVDGNTEGQSCVLFLHPVSYMLSTSTSILSPRQVRKNMEVTRMRDCRAVYTCIRPTYTLNTAIPAVISKWLCVLSHCQGGKKGIRNEREVASFFPNFTYTQQFLLSFKTHMN